MRGKCKGDKESRRRYGCEICERGRGELSKKMKVRSEN